MQHDIVIEQFGVRLRPVNQADAPFIVELRNGPRAVGNIGDTSASIEKQEQWIHRYFERPNDYYFIIETTRNGQPVGTIGIYDLNGPEGEWGRWVIMPGVCAAPASAWLVLKACFELLRLTVAWGHVVETNKPVVAFHHKMGNHCVGYAPELCMIGGKPVRQWLFQTTLENWPAIARKLEVYAQKAQPLLERSLQVAPGI